MTPKGYKQRDMVTLHCDVTSVTVILKQIGLLDVIYRRKFVHNKAITYEITN